MRVIWSLTCSERLILVKLGTKLSALSIAYVIKLKFPMLCPLLTFPLQKPSREEGPSYQVVLKKHVSSWRMGMRKD